MHMQLCIYARSQCNGTSPVTHRMNFRPLVSLLPEIQTQHTKRPARGTTRGRAGRGRDNVHERHRQHTSSTSCACPERIVRYASIPAETGAVVGQTRRPRAARAGGLLCAMLGDHSVERPRGCQTRVQDYGFRLINVTAQTSCAERDLM